jgi:hypothetical protein
LQRYTKDAVSRNCKIYVPIDVDLVGKKFGVDGDIIFGRLHYHFNNKYGYKNDDGSKVFFFLNGAETNRKKEKHLVHFPYLASVLADLRLDRNRYLWATRLSILSLIVAIIALAF